MNQPTNILFVCLGNICRSPLAEHLFRRLTQARGVQHRFHAESRGMGGWHVGDPADPRTVAVAARFGWTLDHVARQFQPQLDIPRFQLIIPMDKENMRALLEVGTPPERLRLMRSFDPNLDPNDPPDVPDPYYGGPEGFLHMYHMLEQACQGLLEHLLNHNP
jgi:protein-tyrosine phosphatase